MTAQLDLDAIRSRCGVHPYTGDVLTTEEEDE